MRIVVIDPFLKNQSGHHYLYTMGIYDTARSKSIPILVFGNKSANLSELKLDNFYPLLEDVSSEVFRFKQINFINLVKIIKLQKKFIKQLKSSLYNILKPKDIFIFHTPYIFELIPFSFFLYQIRKDILKKRLKIFLGFNFQYKREQTLLTFIFKVIYILVDKLISKKIKNNVIYFSDGENLKKEYERLLKKEIIILPFPFYPFTYKLNVNKVDTKMKLIEEKNNYLISYIGGARYNKGFDIFVNFVESVIKIKEIEKKVSFVVQVDIHEKQTLADVQNILEYVKKINNLALLNDSIRIIKGHLDMNSYYEIMMNSDIIVLPYRYLYFKNSVSNIFIETILMGKIPVVSSNTSMSYQLLKYKLEDFVFDCEKVNNLVLKILNILNNIEENRNKMIKICCDFRNFYSKESFISKLINYAN